MIVAAYRVKNEALWIAESLMRSLAVADAAVVFDDNSTDETVAIAESFPGVSVIRSPFSDFGEARDKDFLLDKLVARGARWVIALDGDEVLTPTAMQAIRVATSGPVGGMWVFRIAYLWDSPHRERCDGLYDQFMRPVLWSLFDQKNLTYRKTRYAGGAHCGRMPQNHVGAKHTSPPATIKHYGYLHEAQRAAKYAIKTERDPQGHTDGLYSHIIGQPSHYAPGPIRFRPFADT